jgi:hypothetical protein
MTIVRDENTAIPALAIVEKYEAFVDYLYPILRTCPRVHSVARDLALACLLGVPAQLYAAAKTQQVSKLYAVDGDFATLRFWLRFCVHPSRRIITPRQHSVALAMLAETGRMLGGWISTLRQRGRAGS